MFTQMTNWETQPVLQARFPRVSDYLDSVVITQSRYYRKLRREQTNFEDELPISPQVETS